MIKEITEINVGEVFYLAANEYLATSMRGFQRGQWLFAYSAVEEALTELHPECFIKAMEKRFWKIMQNEGMTTKFGSFYAYAMSADEKSNVTIETNTDKKLFYYSLFLLFLAEKYSDKFIKMEIER